MQVGLLGVGKMGGGLLRRWRKAGHQVVAFDLSPEAAAVISAASGTAATSVEQLVQQLATPRIVWLMVPAGDAVAAVMKELEQQLDPEDTVIDGGNSNWQDSRRSAGRFSKRNINYVDVGVSGGVAGEQVGYAMMIGGEQAVVKHIKPLLEALATTNTAGELALAHVGPSGAGHYVKMVHNAVEYGMMQAIGEGFDLLKHGSYSQLDVTAIAKLWSSGTVVRSFLMESAHAALVKDDSLHNIAGYVEDNGEGRWAVKDAVDNAVPFTVNTAALYARFQSRIPDSFSAKLIAALRQEFGGHGVRGAK